MSFYKIALERLNFGEKMQQQILDYKV